MTANNQHGPTIKASAIVCAHNPRRDYLDRALDALRRQTLPQDQWELLVIDNASRQPLAETVDLSWHSGARVVREEQLGLTPARLRGFAESRGDLLVFVDDDNVLDADYLEIALTIARERPYLGAWGGQILPQFEEPPPEWSREFWPFFPTREVNGDRWTNQFHVDCLPWGAGMCIRRDVFHAYCELLKHDPIRRQLGRTGSSLLSGEDVDMALTACDIEMGIGVFQRLKLTHLIPPSRLELAYLLRLLEGCMYSIHVVSFIRTGAEPPRVSWLGLANQYRKLLFKPSYERARFFAAQRSVRKAYRTIAELRSGSTVEFQSALN